MERITSTEFQKAYPRLTEPTEVTALGRVIGTWYPFGTSPIVGQGPAPTTTTGASYSTRPFSPAPKPGSKKK